MADVSVLRGEGGRLRWRVRDLWRTSVSDAQDWDFWLDEIAMKGVNLTSFEIDFAESLA